jgi:hypothetical protein
MKSHIFQSVEVAQSDKLGKEYNYEHSDC